MKRSFVLLTIVAAAAVMSCNKVSQEVEPIENAKSYVYTINASIADAIDVKSDYDADGKFSWSAGDAISVLFHKGDDNQFFSLTTTGTGASASFSGVIDDGYVIGASDGTVEDKKIWVLFPASSGHSYTAGSLPTFFMTPETDFTAPGAHYSANLPMYDLLAAEGNISFKNLCSGYVFTFTNVAAAVNTVMVTVDNNAATYKFSGALPLAIDGEEYCIKPDWGDAGPARVLSYIAAVDKVKNNVVIYVPTRRNTEYFQPVIDMIDYETGNTIVHLVAAQKKTSPVRGTVQPITINTNNSTGTPHAFESAFGIDWSSVTDSFAGNSATESDHNDKLSVFKAKADAGYIYLFFEMQKDGLLTDPTYEYANSIDVYLGNSESESSSWMWDAGTMFTVNPFTAWLTKDGAPAVNSWEGIYAGSGSSGGHAEAWAKKCAFEVKLKRSYNVCLQVAGTINIGMVINYQKYHGGNVGSNYMYVPSNGESMLQITAPAYVAP